MEEDNNVAVAEKPKTQSADTEQLAQRLMGSDNGTIPPQGASTGLDKKRNKWTGIIAGVVVVGLLGAFAFFAFLKPKLAEGIVADAVVNTLDAEAIDLSVSLSSSEAESQIGISSIDLDLFFKDGYLDAGLSTEIGAVGKIGFELVGIINSPDGAADEGYFKINGLDSLLALFLPAFGGTLGADFTKAIEAITQPLDNQWIVVDSEEETEAQIDQEQAEEDVERFLNALKAAYDKHTFVTIEEILEDDQINGRDNHHALLSIDQEELRSFIEAAVKESNPLEDFDEDTFKAIDQFLDEFDFDKTSSEVWVDKELTFVSRLIIDTDADGVDLKLSMDFNPNPESREVVLPKDAKTLEEIEAEIDSISEGIDLGLPVLDQFVN